MNISIKIVNQGLIISLLIFIFTSQAFAVNTDSLYISKLQNKALDLNYSYPDSSRLYCKKAIKESEKINDAYLIAKSYNILGIYYDITNQWDSAFLCYGKAIKIASKCDCKSITASALNNIGLIYWNKSENELAIEYYEKSLTLFEGLGKEKGAANTLNNIGLILRDQDRYEEALQYQKRALAIREKIQDNYGISASYTNIGILYSELNNYDSAIYYLHKAIALKLPLNDNYGLAITYTNLATTFKKNTELDSGIYYYKKAIAIHKSLNNKKLIASNISSLGSILIMKRKYKQAEMYLLDAESISLGLDDKKELYGIQHRLGLLYYKMNKYKKSAEYYRESTKNQTQVYRSERDRKIEEINEKYKTEKREKEIALQKAELAETELKLQQRDYVITGIVFIAMIVSALFLITYRQQRFRNKKLRQENALKDELSEIKIKNQVNHERLRISRDLHDNIGSQLTFIISSIDNMTFRLKHGKVEIEKPLSQLNEFTKKTIGELRDTIWALNREIITETDLQERIFHLSDLGNKSIGRPMIVVDFEDNFQFSISSLQGIEIFRIIQEATNNALKYSKATSIKIKVFRNNGGVKFEIIDNGRGFDINEVKLGRGLINMQKRASLINCKLEIKSQEDKGTIISIECGEIKKS